MSKAKKEQSKQENPLLERQGSKERMGSDGKKEGSARERRTKQSEDSTAAKVRKHKVHNH